MSEPTSARCEVNHPHDEVIRRILAAQPPEETLYDLAELFKVFGDSTRVRILYALFASELCVYDIAELLGMTQSAISHQLRILKQARLVKYRREGKQMLYALDDAHIQTIFETGLAHVSETYGSRADGE